MGGEECLHRPGLLGRESRTDDDFLDPAVVGMRGRIVDDDFVKLAYR